MKPRLLECLHFYGSDLGEANAVPIGNIFESHFSGPIPTSNAQIRKGVMEDHPRRSQRGLFSDLEVIELSISVLLLFLSFEVCPRRGRCSAI